jgi:hypothetical protein
VIRNLTRILFPRWTARRRYFAVQAQAAEAWTLFAAPPGDARSRVDALRDMAACERVMADTAFGFRDADEQGEVGLTQAQWTGMSALLTEMVADTEVKAYDLDQPLPGRRSNLTDDPAVAEAIERLSAETELAARAELTVALYRAVIGRVGGQAAEVLAALACSYYELAGLSMKDAMARVGYPSDDSDMR